MRIVYARDIKRLKNYIHEGEKCINVENLASADV